MLRMLRPCLFSFISLVLLAGVMQGCGVYSFSGAALSPEVETVTVQRFPNNADLVNPELSQLFTQKLRQKLLQDTNLELVEQGGDIVFSGTIERYNVSAEVVQRGQQASKSELSIGIKTQYKNKVDQKSSFDQLFSSNRTFDQSESLSQVEDELVEEITDNIIQNIFNESINDW